MKKQKIKYAVLYYILALIWGIFIVSLFMGCNVYEKETVEIIRCPINTEQAAATQNCCRF